MIGFIKHYIGRYMPEIAIEYFEGLIRPSRFILKQKIRSYFLSLDRSKQEQEIVKIIIFFEKHRFSVFPYDFCKEHSVENTLIYYDDKSKMHYIEHNKKQLYFPNNYDKYTITRCYNSLCIEQDINSPHRYQTEEFNVKNGDVIADIGAAEGIWALDNVERAGKVYLFERDSKWINALQKTFEPWKEKVVIVQKYVSNENDNSKVSLDEVFKDKEINFIKADIEGAEIELLKGGESVLSRNGNMRLLLCTYHRENDDKKLKEILENNGFKTEYSKGYMLYIFDKKLKEPYIRQGLIRAKKQYHL